MQPEYSLLFYNALIFTAMKGLLIAIEHRVLRTAEDHPKIDDSIVLAAYRTYRDYFSRLLEGAEEEPPTGTKMLDEAMLSAIWDELVDREELELDQVLLDPTDCPTLDQLYVTAFEALSAGAAAVPGKGKRSYLKHIEESGLVDYNRKWLRETYGIRTTPHKVRDFHRVTDEQAQELMELHETDHEEAVRRTQNLLLEHPGDERLHLMLITLYFLNDGAEAALAANVSAMKKFPESPILLANYFMLLLGPDDTLERAHLLRPLLDFAPTESGFYEDKEYLMLEQAHFLVAVSDDREEDAYRHMEDMLKFGRLPENVAVLGANLLMVQLSRSEELMSKLMGGEDFEAKYEAAYPQASQLMDELYAQFVPEMISQLGAEGLLEDDVDDDDGYDLEAAKLFASLGIEPPPELGGAGGGKTRVDAEGNDYRFPVGRPANVGKIYQIKISLNGSKPPIWRRILVAADTPLSEFSDVILNGMGWIGGHLHQFHWQNEYFTPPNPFGDNDWDFSNDYSHIQLNHFLKRPNTRFRFEYDFGDGWDHTILLEKILEPDPRQHYPVCIKGKRACPPEDVGGIWGYEAFLEAMSDPKHPEHENMLEWVGGEWDAEEFDPKDVIF